MIFRQNECSAMLNFHETMQNPPKELAVFQAQDGAITLKKDLDVETIWASKKQIAEIFGVDRSVVSRHIKNIFEDQELNDQVVCAKFAHTTKHGSIKTKEQTRMMEFFNLDIVLAVGYRTKSSIAVEFRKWATKTLKEHITKGFTINPERIQYHHEAFLKAVEDIKLLAEQNTRIENSDILELIKTFSYTWFSLESYDKNTFPQKGRTQEITVSGKELFEDIQKLKAELIAKKEASEMFAREKQKGALEGIVGNVFQSVFGNDAYPSIEEKSAHLLYFIVKNHPFHDGNKRSGAFAFVWLLQKSGICFLQQISPQTLATLALLIAESNPKEKDKMIGLILLLLQQ